MKILLLIRHAQAEKGKPGQSDAERRLTDKGKSDAEYIARQLSRLGLIPVRILCSSSARTLKTARIMAREWDLDSGSIQVCEPLYEGDFDTYMNCICTLEDREATVALVGHNPTMAWLARHFGYTSDEGSFPTCATAVVKVDSDTWTSFSRAGNVLEKVLIP